MANSRQGAASAAPDKASAGASVGIGRRIVNRACASWVDLSRAALDVLAPGVCYFCDAPEPGGLCAPCAAELPWNHRCCPLCALPQAHEAPCRRCLARPPHFSRALAPFRLESPLHDSVHRLKYQADFRAARLLGRLSAEYVQAQPRAAAVDLLLPVPLHWTRLAQRGYNQSALLAQHMGRQLGLPVAQDSARRLRATADQIGQSAAARRRNLRGAFQVDAQVRDRHVALVDDVMTTGATLDALALACLRAGAASVLACPLARVA
jgi:ComF family protein